MAAASLAACAGGDAPTQPPAPPVTPPPAQNPETPPPAPTLGALVVELSDVPTGAQPSVKVSSGGFQRIVRQSRTVDSLPPGIYEVSADDIVIDSVRYSPEPASQSVEVLANKSAPRAKVRFERAGAAIHITSTGLPSYARATVRLSGPENVSRTALTNDTVRLLPGGDYTLTADPVETTNGRFVPSPETVTVRVNGNQIGTANFKFVLAKGSLTVTANGLPNGALAGIRITGPDGFNERADATQRFDGLESGTYRATAARVQANGFSYDPNRTTADVVVSGTQSRSMDFNYSLATGAIAVTIGGLPSGTNGSVTVTGPSGFSRVVTSTQTLINLAPGAYRVTAAAVTANGVSYTATPSTVDVTVGASMVAVPAAIQYGGSMGTMTLRVEGLPLSLDASIKVIRPNGTAFWLTGSETVSDLPIGTYTIEPQVVKGPKDSYDPDVSSRKVQLRKDETVNTEVRYSPRTGGINVSVLGLPTGALAAVRVTGAGTDTVFTKSGTVMNLDVGTYTITAANVVSGSMQYVASPASASVSVTRGSTTAHTVSYGGQSTALTVDFSGLPGGTSPSAVVTGPNGYSATLTSARVLENLAAGTYRVSSATVTTSTAVYSASPGIVDVSLGAGNRKSQQIAYSLSTGSLAISVAGLPSGTSAAVTVTGPNNFSRSITGSETLIKLTPGTYSVAAQNISANGVTYTASPSTRSVTVTASITAAAAPISYGAAFGGMRVTIGGLPSQVAGAVTLSGPNNASMSLSQTSLMGNLAIGTWTVRANDVTIGGDSYSASPSVSYLSVVANDTVNAAVAFARTTGHLAITVNGLPSGSSANVTVTGPNSFSRNITSSQTLVGLVAGTYTVSAAAVNSGSTSYTPSSSSQTVEVSSGGSAARTVSYSGSTTSLSVNVSGVPSGASAAVTVTGPSGFTESLSSTNTLSGLNAGTYSIVAARLVVGSYGYVGSPASQSVSLTTGDNKSASVAFAVSTGALTVNVAGLPSGTSAPITVTGPSGFTRTVASSQTLSDLAPGSYTLDAGAINSGSSSFAPSTASQTVSVTAGVTASRSVTYTGSSTSLSVEVSGVPSGVSPTVTVTGPNSFSQTLSATKTFSALTAGTYTVAAARVVAGNYGYTGSPASQSVALATGDNKSAAVAYAVSTGALTVNVAGLPSGTSASITVTGPSGFSRAVTSSQTLGDLAPGSYTVAATSTTGGTSSYTASAASQTVSVTAGATASRSVTYTGSNTSLSISLSGLPSGVNGAVTVTGPNSFTSSVTSSTTLTGLAAGTYTIAAASVSNNGFNYAASPASASVAISTGTSTSRAVTYSATNGKLSISISGVPSGTNAAVSVTGPNSYSQNVTASTTLSGLSAGTYTVAASNISASGSTYAPSTASQTVGVTVGATASNTVTYAVSGGGDSGGGGTGSGGANLSIEGAYVTQAIQSFAGDVPLVSGRKALLRVFVKADASNSLTPTVRVRLSTGGSPFRTFTINAPSTSVPTSISEGTLNSSWNAALSASDMRAGLRIQVDVDPTNAVSESSESDNIWPRSGTQSLDVRSVAPVSLVFVPVHRSVSGTTGNVTSSNMESNFASLTRNIFPLSNLNASVRSPYTTNAADLQSGDGNKAWLTILSEMNSLRTADGSSAFYYGVVSTSYGSGVAGYAYTPGRAAVGWDKSGTSNRIAAHEIGHNFGRRHVAACLSSNTDASYPYSGGTIGNYGWNPATGGIVNTSVTDIMGYCGTQWISDYTWSAVMSYLGAAPMMAAFSTGPQTSLLVWGRIQNGQVTLEPAVRLMTTPSVAQRGGSYRLELRDADGRVLTGFTFDPEIVDHDENAAAFSFAVPLSALADSRLASVAIVGPSGTVEQVARVAAASMVGGNQTAPVLITADNGSATVTDPAAVITRSGNMARVNWDAQTWPLALVKDAQSGQTLSYLRESGHGFLPRGSAVRVIFSNGVQSVTKILNVP